MSGGVEVLAPGNSFGRYTIVRKLGAGGMGAVYEAQHVELKKRVAIKALLPSMADNPELRARFVREGEAAARIRHPHVVDVYDVGYQEGVAFLVMEYLEGEDLGARIRREKPMAIERLADIMIPVCGAISAAHDEGVLHRDLKPANVFLARGRHGEIHPKVLDFGISKILADPLSDGLTQGLTGTGAVLGTPYYMSPEQAHGGKTLDARSDQYSLGVILFQCATGEKPFDAPSMYQVLHRIVQGDFQPPAKIRPDLPPGFEQVVLRAMAREPEGRFPSVTLLGAALLPFASERVRVYWTPTFDPAGSLRTSAPPPAPPPGTKPAEVHAAPLAESGLHHANTYAAAENDGVTALPAPPTRRLAMIGVGVAALVLAGAAYVAFSGDSAVDAVAIDPAPAVQETAPSPAAPADPPAAAAAVPEAPAVAPAPEAPAAAPAPEAPAAAPAPAAVEAPKPAAGKAKPIVEQRKPPRVRPPTAPKPAAEANPVGTGANNAPILE